MSNVTYTVKNLNTGLYYDGRGFNALDPYVKGVKQFTGPEISMTRIVLKNMFPSISLEFQIF